MERKEYIQNLEEPIQRNTDFINIAENIIKKIPLFYNDKEGWYIRRKKLRQDCRRKTGFLGVVV